MEVEINELENIKLRESTMPKIQFWKNPIRNKSTENK